ncbi:hypothetical protein TNCT_276351 [Trichonephila clavata]|uniref:Uncharacterized protein n=1 Tax=Trichonephila clavata TaxID=2740835 RepID=A0A8X6L3J2_TRICU|nr:hypothetical protein TNCT_276351 [Trichonephila clavata]
MDVTQLKTQQKSMRTSFTISAKTVEEELTKEVLDLTELSILKLQIGGKISRLEQCQSEQCLQLGIAPKHRDFLKFFHPDKGEEIVYRHC